MGLQLLGLLRPARKCHGEHSQQMVWQTAPPECITEPVNFHEIMLMMPTLWTNFVSGPSAPCKEMPWRAFSADGVADCATRMHH